MNYINYKILEKRSPFDLAFEVREHLSHGWKLIGQPYCVQVKEAVFPNSDCAVIDHFQAITKNEKR